MPGTQVKAFTKEKEIVYCFLCPEYPCRTLDSFIDNNYIHRSIIFCNHTNENERKERRRCDGCGTKFPRYDE
ncbi:MAG: hypothetical protein WBK52_04920 [Bacilli bacterium]